MILSDTTIRTRLEKKQITIEPFVDEQLQPASYDVRLGDEFLVFDNTRTEIIDPRKDNAGIMRKVKVDEERPFILHPNEFALTSTHEVIGVDEEHVCTIHGKSSLGRLGLLVHASAGWIDPGNTLRPTLHLFNVATMPIKLYPMMKIAQVTFEQLTEACERPYGSAGLGSKYVGTMGVAGSQMHRNFSA
jgi:dCTP deaminase